MQWLVQFRALLLSGEPYFQQSWACDLRTRTSAGVQGSVSKWVMYPVQAEGVLPAAVTAVRLVSADGRGDWLHIISGKIGKIGTAAIFDREQV